MAKTRPRPAGLRETNVEIQPASKYPAVTQRTMMTLPVRIAVITLGALMIFSLGVGFLGAPG